MKLLIIALLVIVSAADARAAKCSKAGKKLWTDGAKYYDLSNFEKAIELWEKAYLECSDPELLFNLAQAYRKSGNLPKARDLFKSWLREHPSPDAADKADVEKKIADLDAMIAAQKASAESPPEGLRPKEGVETAPSVEPQPSETARPADPPPPQATVSPAPQPMAPRDEPPRWYSDRRGWILAGVGVATLATGGGLYVWSGSLADDARAARDEADATLMFDDADEKRMIGVVTMGVGGAFIVAGIVRFAISGGGSSHRDVAVTVGPGTIGMAWSF